MFAQRLVGSSRPPPPTSNASTPTPTTSPTASSPPHAPEAPRRIAEDCAFLGRFEEAQEHWEQAAAHFTRAFESFPDAMYAAHAADDLRRAHGDLHAAARYAEWAVAHAPGRAELHLVLGLVYRDAGLTIRARAEVERALRIDPENEHGRRFLAELTRC